MSSSLSATWTRLISTTRLQRSSQILSVVGPNAYIFGGELLPRQPVDSNLDVIKLGNDSSDITASLSTPPNAPSPRVGTASAVLNDSLWLFSGRGGIAMDPVEESGSLWRYTPSSGDWQMVTPTSSIYPAARSYHSMTADGAKTIYVHAGCPTKGRLSDLWAFDTETHTWSELPAAPPPARGGTSIAFRNGNLYRMGGFDGTTEQGGQIDVYDPTTKAWSTLSFPSDGAQGPEARSVAALLTIKHPSGKDLLVTLFGERDPSSLGHAGAGKMLGDAWAYDFDAKRWNKIDFAGDTPAPRGWFDADVWKLPGGDAVIIHGGLAEDNTRLGDVWKLTFN
ncbi:kelch repeat protein [Paramyrothecium foliicola]|nr:kelch repeat protein [Paramyrothecium foliicola]